MPVHAGPLDDGRRRDGPVPRAGDAAHRHGRPDALPGDVPAHRRGRAARAPASSGRRSRRTSASGRSTRSSSATRTPQPVMGFTQLRVLGGAMGRVPADATAFAHRDAVVMASIIAGSERGRSYAEAVAWTDAYQADLSDGATGVYSNFLADEGAARLHAGLPGRHVRAARPGQAPRRPGEPVPRQPQHPARLTVRGGRRARPIAPASRPRRPRRRGRIRVSAPGDPASDRPHRRTLGQGNVIAPPPALKPEASCWRPADSGPPRARQPERPHDRLLRPPGARSGGHGAPPPFIPPAPPAPGVVLRSRPPPSAAPCRHRQPLGRPGFAVPPRRSRASAPARPAPGRPAAGAAGCGSSSSPSSRSSSSRAASRAASGVLGPGRDRRRVAGAATGTGRPRADRRGVAHDPRQLRRRQEPRRPGPRLRRDPGHGRGGRRRGPHAASSPPTRRTRSTSRCRGKFVGIGVQITPRPRTGRPTIQLDVPEHAGRGGRASSAATGSSAVDG